MLELLVKLNNYLSFYLCSTISHLLRIDGLSRTGAGAPFTFYNLLKAFNTICKYSTFKLETNSTVVFNLIHIISKEWSFHVSRITQLSIFKYNISLNVIKSVSSFSDIT